MSAFWATVSQTEKAETPRRTKNELNAECLLWPSTACTGSDLPGALGTLISQVGLGAVSQPPAAPGQGDGPVLPANVVVAKPGEVAAVSGVRAGASRVLLSEIPSHSPQSVWVPTGNVILVRGQTCRVLASGRARAKVP